MSEIREMRDNSQRTIVGIGDLKKIIGSMFGIGILLVGYLCQHYNGQLIVIASQIALRVEADHAQDKKIQKLEDNLEESKRNTDRTERSSEAQQKILSDMLLQLSQLSGKVSSTEETSRSTREQLEKLLEFVRKENRNAVITTEDSIYAPRGIQR